MSRLLLVSPSALPGGAERAFLGLARRLPAAGWEPVCALLEEGPLESWLRGAGCAVEVVPAGRVRELHRTAATIARLARLARRTRVHAVVANMAKGHLYALPAAVSAGVPEMWWQHRPPGPPDPLELLAARLPAAAVACAGRDVAERQRRLGTRSRLLVLHPGIPLAEVAARSGAGRTVRQALGWDGAPLVGIVARLQRFKGHAVFLRAAARLAAERPELRFVVVGGVPFEREGDYPGELRRLAESLGLNGQLHFAGHQPNPWDWLDALDVVVSASAQEGFPLVALEAMALGKAVVAAASPGQREVLVDGVSGLLVPTGDAGATAEAVGRLLDDDALRARVAESGRARAARFGEERTAERLAALLGDLVRRAER